MSFDPYYNLVGGFSANDGSIDFYLRINALIKSSDTVLDLGAGRAAWFEDDTCDTRKGVRLLKGKVAKVIAADLDEIVLKNNASDEQIVITNGKIGVDEKSVDIVIADFVLEHIADPKEFVEQVDFVLKEGGWFCARTPHKISYVAIIASLIGNKFHSKVLSKVQPNRKEIDVFPTAYKLNTMGAIKTHFDGWNHHSFIFRCDPSYYFRRKTLYRIQELFHRFMFKEFSGNIFVFVQKK